MFVLKTVDYHYFPGVRTFILFYKLVYVHNAQKLVKMSVHSIFSFIFLAAFPYVSQMMV